MHGLETVNLQLDAVSQTYDCENHAEEMRCLDAQIAELNQKIRVVLSVHEFVVELDAICMREIQAGRVAPSEEMHSSVEQVIERFRVVCESLSEQADQFISKGIPIDRIMNIRRIADFPAAGLSTVAMFRVSREIVSNDGMSPEIAFDDAIFKATAEAGKAYRNVG